MGHQLWTSPITGYRRRGTSLAELRGLFEKGITVHSILEPLLSCPFEADALEMVKILSARGFDVAGVQRRQEGGVIGYVFREELCSGIVFDHVRPIDAEILISDGTPLAGLFSVLKARERVFVLIGTDVRGIITRADLNKPPVRVYLFGLISLLEMHLTSWVRIEYKGDGWKGKLTPEQLRAAQSIQNIRRSRNQDTDLLDCLHFRAKKELVLAHDKLRFRLKLEEEPVTTSMFERAQNLRNNLAHSHQDLVEGTSWEEQADLVAWTESLVHRSDGLVEKEATKSADGLKNDLWASA